MKNIQVLNDLMDIKHYVHKNITSCVSGGDFQRSIDDFDRYIGRKMSNYEGSSDEN